MRTIDADELLETSDVFIVHTKEYGSIEVISVDAVGDAPTVDAVPVVRCRECKYRFKNNGHDKSGCPIIDANIWMDDDDFCSYGERKEGADNG